MGLEFHWDQGKLKAMSALSYHIMYRVFSETPNIPVFKFGMWYIKLYNTLLWGNIKFYC